MPSIFAVPASVDAMRSRERAKLVVSQYPLGGHPPTLGGGERLLAE